MAIARESTDSKTAQLRRGRLAILGCSGFAVVLAVLLVVVVGMAYHMAMSKSANFQSRRDILASLVHSRVTVEEARQRRGSTGRLISKPDDPYSVAELQGIMDGDRQRIEPSLGRTTQFLVFADGEAVEILLLGSDGRAMDYVHYLR